MARYAPKGKPKTPYLIIVLAFLTLVASLWTVLDSQSSTAYLLTMVFMFALFLAIYARL